MRGQFDPESEDDREILRAMIRRARSDAGLGQIELATRLGKPQSFISKIECGERRLDVLELRALCRALDISLVDFVASLEEALNRPT